MNQWVLTPEQRAAYDRDGFVMVRGLFDPEEALLLQKAMETDPQVRGNLYNRNDAQGLATKMVLWNHPGDSVYGLAARSHRVVDTMESLLGGEVILERGPQARGTTVRLTVPLATLGRP